MKKNYLIVGVVMASLGFFAFQSDNVMKESVLVAKASHLLQSAGGQNGFTGAPLEANCTSCHVGQTQDGSSENTLSVVNASFQPVTSYTPGDTYTVSLQMTSNPTKKGFSATALDAAADMPAGSFVGSGIGGTQAFSANGRSYVSHTASSNTDATTLWAWTWTAPATNVGDVVFYVASNAANNNGANTGDVIYLSQHTIGSVADIDEQEAVAETSFNAGYSAEANKVVIDFTSLTSGAMFFNLVDMNGKSVYSKPMADAMIGQNKHSVALPSSIENGMYVVNFFVGNKAMSANILVQR
jgi:hypothetical protein